MEQINYVPLLPKEPPEDLIGWALGQQDVLNKEYLIYRDGRRYLPLEDRVENCVEVVCSACGNEFTATKTRAGGCSQAYAPAPFGWWNEGTGEHVISGNVTLCPYCGGQTETKHIGSIRDVITQRAWVAVFYRLPVEGRKDRLALVDWMVARDIDKRGNSRYWTHLHSAWVVEEKKIVRIAGPRRNYYVTSLTKPEQQRSYRDDFGEAQLVYPWDPALLNGTTAENSKIDLYQQAGGKRLVAYLGLYLKKPAVENLVMQGLASLVVGLLDSECGKYSYKNHGGYAKLADWINWKEKRPAKMLGMNREQLRIFKENNWGVDHLNAISWARSRGIPLTMPGDVEHIRAVGTYRCGAIVDEQPISMFWKIMRYTKRHGCEYATLRDYWNMAARLEMNLADDQVRWPKDLKTAHDKAVERYNAQKDALTTEAFDKRERELHHLSWAANGLMIRPCASAAELRNEGKALHHCVATYAERHAEGRTAIFFIRRVDKPDEPYYTLELDEKDLIVRQNRGLRNCGKTEEVQAFENAWLDWAKNK